MSKFSLLPLLLIYSCAVVVHPTGGPEDITPPQVVKVSPDSNSTNFQSKTISLQFTEFITLKDPTGIILSPPTKEKVKTRIKGKELFITLPEVTKDITYQLHLHNAIADVNESNELGDFILTFSTGNTIDTGVIKGKTKDHLTKKDLADITLALIPNTTTSDSFPFPLYVTKSTGTGEFYFNNLPDSSTYTLIAFKDQNNNNLPEAGEAFAYQKNVTSNSGNTNLLTLSTPRGLSKTSILKTIPIDQHHTKFLVKDLPTHFNIINTKKANGKSERLIIRQKNIDTIDVFDYYIYEDNSRLYLLTDTTNNILDSVAFKASSDIISSISISSIPHSGKLEPSDTFTLVSNNPLLHFKTEQLSLLQDSAKSVKLTTKHKSSFEIQVIANYNEASSYLLVLPSETFIDHYEQTNKTDTFSFNTVQQDKYGIITTSWPDTSSQHFIIELLTDLEQKPVFTYYSDINSFTTPLIPEGNYYIRVIADNNRNGIFDPVQPLEQQPEKVYLHNTIINLRGNWEIEEQLVD